MGWNFASEGISLKRPEMKQKKRNRNKKRKYEKSERKEKEKRKERNTNAAIEKDHKFELVKLKQAYWNQVLCFFQKEKINFKRTEIHIKKDHRNKQKGKWKRK